ncbi:CarD family transcriptional regulator [Zongyangia hominis]|uniref:CarD family transcriptional regulator n=1 Tax=Zongyangia hominis TaxID=2763677 RepID=A0A926EGW6_9FIRM|nr:CarD family transcriptional regulator [Zongyangia hominis]MBC8571452.1 CarD family transcriptional regulator [Zongyangia hominis]
MYHVNDTILYGSHGVCKITGITKKDFGRVSDEYYILEPVYNNFTIYVPMHNDALAEKMHRVLTAEEIQAMIRSMPEEDTCWVENENERKERFKDILARGNRREVLQMIKALYLHQREQQDKGKRLHMADERFFHEAEKMLYDEFALVLNITPEQVLPFILEQIKVQNNG